MSHVGQQNGFVLLPVVLAITLIAVIAFMLNNQSAINVDETRGVLEAAKAEQVARAGLAHATWGIQNSGCAGNMTLPSIPFGADSYQASVTSATVTTAYTVNVDQDTWLKESSPTENHGGDSELSAKAATGDNMRALYRFDLSTIPGGAKIGSATAWFYVTINDDKGAVNIHEVTAAWTEAGATWATMASRFNSVISASILPQTDNGVWIKVNLTSLVQGWVNGSPNNGIMLIATSDGNESRYTSREWAIGSEQPRLEVVATSGPASPVTITATGKLTGHPSPANDITRTLTRTAVRSYQPPDKRLLQPGEEGKDAYILSGNKSDRNTGSGKNMWVSTGSNPHHALVEFDLASLPHGASVLSATLELHTPSVDAATDAVVSIHRITRGWVEGTGVETGTTPADGASWDTYDGVSAWATPGGDYDPRPIDNAPVPDLLARWYSFDITSLVRGWVDGTYSNHGVLVRGSSGSLTKFYIKSGDDLDPALHPKLTITYACECGNPCLGPQGSGTVLMVVVNPTTLVPDDAYKKALFESWGYTVAVLSESANQASYNSAIAGTDVVYISETVNSSQVGTKLAAAPIGVITEDGLYNDALGISNNAGATTGSAINITDTSHYITEIFAPGPLEIYDADMEQLVIFNGPAPDLQELAHIGGYASLVALEAGAALKGGATAAGRRAMLPLGRVGRFNWDYLNNNGRLIVQRTLQWGTGNITGAPLKKVLFVVPDAGSPGSQDTAKQALMESWDYTVSMITASAPQTDFDAAVAAADVAYVSEEIVSTDLGTKLRAATIGVVNEESALVDEFGIAATREGYAATAIQIIGNSHYITAPFSIGPLTIAASDAELNRLTGSPAPGLDVLADSSAKETLVTLDPGDQLFDGGTAAGRRVQLPWGTDNFDINSLNADGLTLMQRALEWGAGAMDAPPQTLLLVVTDADNPSAQDNARKSLMEGWGYTVRLISASDSQVVFDDAVTIANVAYVVEQQQSTALGTKLRDANIGVVYEEAELTTDAGFSSNRDWPSTRDTVDIVDNTHYITSPFENELLTIATSPVEVVCLNGSNAGGLQVLGRHNWSGPQVGLSIIDTGGDLYGGGMAAGRRVQLPWGRTGFDINALNADGLTLMRRAIEWGVIGSGGGGGGGGGDSTVTLTAVSDNRIEAGETLNRGGENNVIVGQDNGNNTEHALVRFDLSSIPAGSTITAATLRLNAYKENGNANWNIEVHRVTEAWTETGSNWDTTDGSTAWSGGGGGSYDPGIEASLPGTVTGWYEWDVSALVQAWHGGTHLNHGVALVPDSTSKRNETLFDSREGGSPPELVISYTTP